MGAGGGAGIPDDLRIRVPAGASTGRLQPVTGPDSLGYSTQSGGIGMRVGMGVGVGPAASIGGAGTMGIGHTQPQHAPDGSLIVPPGCVAVADGRGGIFILPESELAALQAQSMGSSSNSNYGFGVPNQGLSGNLGMGGSIGVTAGGGLSGNGIANGMYS